MSNAEYIAKDPEAEPWDAVVVGTGMGGATAGFALAKQGYRVLFLEKGRVLFEGVDRGDGRLPVDPDERPQGRLLRGQWPHAIAGQTSFGPVEFFAPLGCGTGGTTSIYAAQLERLLPCDFHPRGNFPDVEGTSLPEAWPIAYEELLPYYRHAERLFGVRGTPDPLAEDPESSLREPPPLSQRDERFAERLRELGLHPYRAHVGFDFVPGCEECGGVLCPRDCKADAARICLVPALTGLGAKIVPECEVLRLEADSQEVKAVVCRHGDRELRVRARVVLLAAGALMTPILMLNSRSAHWPEGLANRSGQVGRNLMMHASDFIAIMSSGGRRTGPRKAFALNDFYLDGGVKLGTFQSVGVNVDPEAVRYFLETRLGQLPRWVRRLATPFLNLAAHIGSRIFRGSAVFSTILEDLPYPDNRVVPDEGSKNGMRFEYRYPDELRERTRLFRDRLKARLRSRFWLMLLNGDNNLNYGHVCGTCRFGEDPATSVLDRDNRTHDVDNLYVVDASFFPSSGGTNPSLTIAANALRVADALGRRLATSAPPGGEAPTR